MCRICRLVEQSRVGGWICQSYGQDLHPNELQMGKRRSSFVRDPRFGIFYQFHLWVILGAGARRLSQRHQILRRFTFVTGAASLKISWDCIAKSCECVSIQTNINLVGMWTFVLSVEHIVNCASLRTRSLKIWENPEPICLTVPFSSSETQAMSHPWTHPLFLGAVHTQCTYHVKLQKRLVTVAVERKTQTNWLTKYVNTLLYLL